MTPAERALRDAWLAEMWPTCPEESREERARKRTEDRERRDEMLLRGIHTLSPVVEEMSTGSPESGCEDRSGNAA